MELEGLVAASSSAAEVFDEGEFFKKISYVAILNIQDILMGHLDGRKPNLVWPWMSLII